MSLKLLIADDEYFIRQRIKKIIPWEKLNLTFAGEAENGQQVIDLKQQKTGNHVVIPVRPELQAILEKYDNRLPRTYEQKVNHLIKEIAREAGITEKVEVSYIENGEKKSRLVEKCDLVKTHTARRSGATNM